MAHGLARVAAAASALERSAAVSAGGERQQRIRDDSRARERGCAYAPVASARRAAHCRRVLACAACGLAQLRLLGCTLIGFVRGCGLSSDNRVLSSCVGHARGLASDAVAAAQCSRECSPR
eukprot:6300011-Prymnesium_polylepis.1